MTRNVIDLNVLAKQRRAALLEATLREILRIADATLECPTCIPIDVALEERHAREWNRIVARARALLAATA
jgi:hypothetical protein